MSKEMLMIYADENLEDIGVLQDYQFDECFGDDDNTFQLKVQTANHVCHEGYYVYIEFTEYGGIIDRIESDTKKGEVTYVGRTWHGILNSFVIEPPSGQMYRSFYGSANNVLGQMISLFGLSSLFVVDNAATPNNEVIQIRNFECRYEKLYDSIRRMLTACNGKFKCFFKNGKVHIYSLMLVNYSIMEEFDTSQVPLKIGKTYKQVNHLICLGQGNGADRAVIHLFAKGSEIQPYLIQPNKLPIKDSDYVLDKRYQVYTGLDEIAEIYDYPNAEVITNYEKLTEPPADWNANYHKKYYFFDDSIKDYSLIPQKFEPDFKQVTGNEPPDWRIDSGYQKYYYIDYTNPSDPKYVNVRAKSSSQVTPSWEPMTPAYGYNTAPPNWEESYSAYYTWSDTEQTHVSVKGISKQGVESYARDQKPNDWNEKYTMYSKRYQTGQSGVYFYEPIPEGQTWFDFSITDVKPSRWDSEYYDYYIFNDLKAFYITFNTVGAFVIPKDFMRSFVPYGNVALSTLKDIVTEQIVAPIPAYIWDTYAVKWEAKKYYLRNEHKEIPDWEGSWDDTEGHEAGIYRVYSYTGAPDFVNDGRYYNKVLNTIPDWYGDGRFWKLVNERVEKVPAFTSNTYYAQVVDRMKTLVEGGITKLKKLCDTSSLDIDLELTEDYDIGDIIGGTDEVTKIGDKKAILRKIIKIKKGILSVEHQVE